MRIYLNTALSTLMLTATLMLGSCADNIDVNEDDPKEVQTEGEKAYISFNVGAGAGITTRAEDDGTVGEQKVSSVYLLLFTGSGDNAPLQYCFKLNASNITGSSIGNFSGTDVLAADAAIGYTTGPSKSNFRTVPKPIQKSDYQMVVLANLIPNKIRPTLPGDKYLNEILDQVSGEYGGEVPGSILENNTEVAKYRISNLIHKPINAASPTDFFYEANILDDFTMSNANGVISIPSTNLYYTEDEAKKNPVYIHLDRVVAKVLVRRGENFKAHNGTLHENSLVWGTVVRNKSTYLVRNLTYLSDPTRSSANFQSAEVEKAASGLNPTLVGNELPNRKFKYAIDPNYESEILGEANYELDLSNVLMWNTDHTTVGNSTNDSYQYLLENTISFARQSAANWKDYTTQIEIQATITNPGGLTATNYYSFKTTSGDVKVFTHAQARMWLASSFPTEMGGLAAAIAGATGFDFTSDTPSGAFRTSNNITYHANGLNKYRVPIKHFFITGINSETARTSVYGHYGVVRNNTYIITINSISGPGDGSSERFVSADVSVNPWWIRSFEEEVEY